MNKGFTLIELMIIIAILSITSLFSINGLSELLAKQKVIADTNQIISMIAHSRNLAISKATATRVCGLTNDSQCNRDWSVIQIRSEENGNKLGNGELLYKYQLTGLYKSIDWSSFQRKNYLSFNARGYTNHQNGTLYLCHKLYPALHRAIIISKSGRALIKKNASKVNSRCLRSS